MKYYVYNERSEIFDISPFKSSSSDITSEDEDYVLDLPEKLVKRYIKALNDLKIIENEIYDIRETHLDEVNRCKREKYSNRKSGLSLEEIRKECENRLIDLQFKYSETELTNCSHCKPGLRHIVGDCVLCGCGPAPARMPSDPEPLLIHEINNAFGYDNE